MVRIYLAFFFLISLVSSIWSQDLSDFYKKVEDKLRYDENYLDIYQISFLPQPSDIAGLRNIPLVDDSKFNFNIREGIQYYFVFLRKSLEIDSLVLLEVIEERDKSQTGQGALFGDLSEGGNLETSTVIRFRDLLAMYYDHPEYYQRLYNLVEKLTDEYAPDSKLNLPIEENFKNTRGTTSMGNDDFLRYAWTNAHHYYPKNDASASSGGGRRRSRRGGGGGSATPFKIDFDFAKLTFYHKEMNFGSSILSAEAHFSPDALNLLPWQSMTMSLGIRNLFNVSQGQSRVNNDFLIDAGIRGRFRINTSSFAHKIPFIFVDEPKLNVASGLEVELHTTRLFKLPFLNFYLSTGTDDYTDPFVSFGTEDSSYAFFTATQWETSMSFYWNGNSSRTLRFKMDIGATGHDIIKATYYNGIQTSLIQNDITPLLALSLNFVPSYLGNDTELFGLNLRLSDSIMRMKFWFKVFELSSGHLFRLETAFISNPYYRPLREWENEGSGMVGIRYRYGF